MACPGRIPTIPAVQMQISPLLGLPCSTSTTYLGCLGWVRKDEDASKPIHYQTWGIRWPRIDRVGSPKVLTHSHFGQLFESLRVDKASILSRCRGRGCARKWSATNRWKKIGEMAQFPPITRWMITNSLKFETVVTNSVAWVQFLQKFWRKLGVSTSKFPDWLFSIFVSSSSRSSATTHRRHFF